MRTLDQIKKARESGKRLWGFDLYTYILPMIQQPLSMPEISEYLKEEQDIEISANQLRVLKHRYAGKACPQSNVPPALIPSQIPDAITRKQEATQPSSFSVPTAQPKRNYDFNEDYRTPTPKPTSIFSTKRDEPQQAPSNGRSDFVPTEYIKKDYRRPLPKPKSVSEP